MSNVVRPFAKRVAEAITGTPRQQVESIRNRRLELLDQRKIVDGSRKPLEEAEGSLGALLDAIAGDLDCDLSALADHRTSRPPELLRPGSDIGTQQNVKFLLSLLIASNRTAVRDTLAKRLRSNYDGIGTLSGEERTRRLEEIDAELYRLEIDEERTIRATEIDGSPLLRRADADPRVVLAADLAA